MKKPLLIQKQDRKNMIIDEEQVCSVEQSPHDGGIAILRMANGDTINCMSPTYQEWYNDYLKRN